MAKLFDWSGHTKKEFCLPRARLGMCDGRVKVVGPKRFGSHCPIRVRGFFGSRAPEEYPSLCVSFKVCGVEIYSTSGVSRSNWKFPFVN